MATNPIKQYEYYGEYRFRDIIARLETFRDSIGWGELSDDLDVAIECMEYLLEEAKKHDAEALEKLWRFLNLIGLLQIMVSRDISSSALHARKYSGAIDSALLA